MAVWTTYAEPVDCGFDQHEIPAGEPVALLASGKIKRCRAHAELIGIPFAKAQYDAALKERAESNAPTTEGPLEPWTGDRRMVARAMTDRPKPFKSIADNLHDPRAAAARNDQ